MSRIATGGGDQGITSLLSGQRRSKADPRVEAYGTVDELNAALGEARALLGVMPELGAIGLELASVLLQVQKTLFRLATDLARESDDLQDMLKDGDVSCLESHLDALEQALPPLSNFLIPGESLLDAKFHVARVVCRRAERRVVALGDERTMLHLKYLNLLADLLFTMGRMAEAARTESEQNKLG